MKRVSEFLGTYRRCNVFIQHKLSSRSRKEGNASWNLKYCVHGIFFYFFRYRSVGT